MHRTAPIEFGGAELSRRRSTAAVSARQALACASSCLCPLRVSSYFDKKRPPLVSKGKGEH